MFVIQRSIVLLLTLSLAPSFVAAQGKPATPPHKPAAPAHAAPQAAKETEKKVTYAVVSVGEDMKVMTDAAVEALKKEKHKAFEAATAEYEKAMKAAEAAKKPFDKKAPHEVVVEVKKDGFATESEAKKHLDELLAEKKKHAAPAADGGHPAGHPTGKPKK